MFARASSGGRSSAAARSAFLWRDLERGLVKAARLRVIAHLVEHRALRVQDSPIRLVGRVRLGEDIQRLVILAEIGEGAAIGAEYAGMPRIADRGLLQDGGGLRILAGRPQRLGVGDRDLRIGGARAIALAESIGALPPVVFAHFRRGRWDRAGDVGAIRRAAAECGGKHRGDRHGRRAEEFRFIRATLIRGHFTLQDFTLQDTGSEFRPRGNRRLTLMSG